MLIQTILRGEFNIYGLQNKNIRKLIPQWNSNKISRLLKRLSAHGLIRKIGKTYKYYLTKLGKDTFLTYFKIKELVIIPALNS